MPASHLADLMPTTYRPDLDILVSRWTQQPPPAQLRPVYDELAILAQQQQARYWLQDIRHRAFNDPEITRWLLEFFFADMAARLKGRLHVAYLASPALLTAIQQAPGFAPTETYHGQPFIVAFFNAEGAAFDWLAQEQRREAEAR